MISVVFSLSFERNKALHQSHSLIVNLGVDAAQNEFALSTREQESYYELMLAYPIPQESALWEVSAGGSNEIILSRQPRDYENGLRGEVQCSTLLGVITTGKVTSSAGKSIPGLEKGSAPHLTLENNIILS